MYAEPDPVRAVEQTHKPVFVQPDAPEDPERCESVVCNHSRQVTRDTRVPRICYECINLNWTRTRSSPWTSLTLGTGGQRSLIQ